MFYWYAHLTRSSCRDLATSQENPIAALSRFLQQERAERAGDAMGTTRCGGKSARFKGNIWEIYGNIWKYMGLSENVGLIFPMK